MATALAAQINRDDIGTPSGFSALERLTSFDRHSLCSAVPGDGQAQESFELTWCACSWYSHTRLFNSSSLDHAGVLDMTVYSG